MGVLADLAAILLPVAISIGVGVWLGRRHRDFPTGLIGTLVADIGAPCLVFHSMAAADVRVELLARMALGASVCVVLFGIVGVLLVKLARWPAHTFVAPMVFSNTGNMGLPLCLFAFGQEGLGLSVAVFATFAIWQFSLGIWLWAGEASPMVVLRSPLAWAGIGGFAIQLLGWRLPGVVANTTQLLGGLAVPLMLITLGVSLSTMQARNLPRTAAVSAFRLLLGPAVGWGVATAIGLSGTARGVLTLQCAMPVAVFNYLLALRYQRSPEEVASLVVGSTSLSVITLPVLLWLVLDAF